MKWTNVVRRGCKMWICTNFQILRSSTFYLCRWISILDLLKNMIIILYGCMFTWDHAAHERDPTEERGIFADFFFQETKWLNVVRRGCKKWIRTNFQILLSYTFDLCIRISILDFLNNLIIILYGYRFTNFNFFNSF